MFLCFNSSNVLMGRQFQGYVALKASKVVYDK